MTANPLQWILDAFRDYGFWSVTGVLLLWGGYNYFTGLAKVKLQRAHLENRLFEENVETVRREREHGVLLERQHQTNIEQALNRLSDGLKAIAEAVNLIRTEQANQATTNASIITRLTTLEALLSSRGEQS